MRERVWTIRALSAISIAAAGRDGWWAKGGAAEDGMRLDVNRGNKVRWKEKPWRWSRFGVEASDRNGGVS